VSKKSESVKAQISDFFFAITEQFCDCREKEKVGDLECDITK